MRKHNDKADERYVPFKITAVDKDGELLAAALDGKYKNRNFPLKSSRRLPAPAVGDEFLGKLQKTAEGFCVKAVSRLAGERTETGENLFGTIERQNHVCLVTPVERGAKPIVLGENKTLKNGDFVEIAVSGSGAARQVSVVKNLGPFSMEKLNEVLIAQKYKLPQAFERDVTDECRKFPDFAASERVNLCELPFVTIDGDDSKDFDDAVYACRTDDGFGLIVAIADVSFYVRPGSALDREACRRGNSVYLPQTVIPMLPEILSNDLCSLNPGVKRPAIACFMQIDRAGNLLDWEFRRVVIKSAARLTYKETEAAIRGEFNGRTKKLFKTAIAPLYEAYQALALARKRRGALELETTEVKIRLDKNGNVAAVEKRESLVSHKIIEEFMIAANVAAARRLQLSKQPVMYRVHDRPSEEKLKEIKPLLDSLKLKLPDCQALKPEHFNRLIELCRQKDRGAGIDDLVLRLQCQAQYSPQNIGHFGLGLKEYVHFTSPIRRYADLLIHRALVNACAFSPEEEEMPSQRAFAETADHLCTAERAAAAAERDLTARYLSLYLKPLTGTEFEVKISGLTNAGIFVRIESLGAEGLIPMRSLPKDYYTLLDAGSCLKGTENKLKFRLGQKLAVVLCEASPESGGLIFRYAGEDPVREEKPARPSKAKKKKATKTKNKERKKNTKRPDKKA